MLKATTIIAFLSVLSLVFCFGEAVIFGQQTDNPSEKPSAVKTPPSTEEDLEANQAPDLLTSLRDQIAASQSGAERNRLRLALAEQLIAAGKRAEANNELRAITNSDEFDPQGLYNTGNAFARLGDSEQAINAYRKAVEQRKGNYSRALNNLGVMLLRAGRWDEAHDALLEALKLESFRYAEASYNLGRVYSARGENDMAVREWKRAIAVNPEHQAAAHALATSAREGVVIKRQEAGEKNNRSTADRFEASSRRVGAAPFVLDPPTYELLQRARNLRERGKLLDAIQNYQLVISRQHGYFPPANLELSYALLALNRTDDAMANLQHVVGRDGDRYPFAFYYLARLYEQKGKVAEAEAFFVKANAADKTRNYAILLDISRVRQHQGNFKGALSALEEYVSVMDHLGLKPAWTEENLSLLRRKANENPQ